MSLGHPGGKYSGLYSLCRDRGMAGVSEEQTGQQNYEQNKMGVFQDSLKRESQKQIEYNMADSHSGPSS